MPGAVETYGHVDETTMDYSNGSMDILKKINALLENSLDVNALSTQLEANKSENYQQSITSPTYPTGAVSQPSNQELIAGLQNLQLTNLSLAAIQQAVAASKQQDQKRRLLLHAKFINSFIPGAISNRTLEHLTQTESLQRPYRAIKGQDCNRHVDSENANTSVGTIGDSRPSSSSNLSHNQSQQHSPQTLMNMSLKQSLNQSINQSLNQSLNESLNMGQLVASVSGSGAVTGTNTAAGALNSSVMGGQSLNSSLSQLGSTPSSSGPQFSAMSMSSRSVSPESDVSGASAGGNQGQDISDTALLDIMYNLNLSGNKMTQYTQTTPPNNQVASFASNNLSSSIAPHVTQQQQSTSSAASAMSHQQPLYSGVSQQAAVPISQALSMAFAGSGNTSSGLQSSVASSLAPLFQMQGLSTQLPQVPIQYPLHNTLVPQTQVDVLKALGLHTDYSTTANTTSSAGTFPQAVIHPHQIPMVSPNDLSVGVDSLVADRSRLQTLNSLFGTNPVVDPSSIEKAAKLYRNAASVCEATCTWSGQLPPKIYKNPSYSCKVFLGGVPWDITETGLQNAFKAFGAARIEWPQEGKHRIRNPMKAGYVYVLFEADKAVKALLQACTHDFSNGGEYYYKISSRRMRSKEVQVIPWVLSDSNYVKQPSQRLDPTKTVFVGALHGMMNAEGLAHIMNDLFGNVVYAGIDTDKHKYPIGSGRVTFSSHKSFMKAVNAAFVEVKTPKFTKKVQIDPYLEDSLCNSCATQPGPYFCRDLACFRYYCRNCFQWYHSMEQSRHHKPLMRNNARANAEVI